jgi:sugar phosphate isomerase/epimerase
MMSTNRPPVSVQLYSLREASEDNFDAVLEALAQLGFKGVEPFNLFGKSPAAFKQQVNDLGMAVSSSHVPWINRSNSISHAAEVIAALGLKRVPGGYAPDDFEDMDALKRTIDTTAGYVEALKPFGMTLFLHNHYWEFELIEDRPAYHYLQEAVPDVEFQIDTYWAANFGNMDIPSLFNAVDPDVLEWAIIELDQCDTNMMAAVAASYQYLTSHNLVQGNV